MLSDTIKKGDHISINGSDGIVDTINLRYTVIHCAGSQQWIPNSTLLTNTLTIYQE